MAKHRIACDRGCEESGVPLIISKFLKTRQAERLVIVVEVCIRGTGFSDAPSLLPTPEPSPWPGRGHRNYASDIEIAAPEIRISMPGGILDGGQRRPPYWLRTLSRRCAPASPLQGPGRGRRLRPVPLETVSSFSSPDRGRWRRCGAQERVLLQRACFRRAIRIPSGLKVNGRFGNRPCLILALPLAGKSLRANPEAVLSGVEGTRLALRAPSG